MGMLRGTVLVLLVLGLSLAPSMQAQELSPLVGYWKLIKQPYDLTIEFKPDGTYVALTRMGVMSGHWEIGADSRLSTWSSDSRPKKVSEFVLRASLLVITHSNGEKLTHRRITIGDAN